MMRQGRRRAGWGGRWHSDDGSAVVEFLGVTVLLLVPLVYLVLTVGRIQGAMFAAESAAREAGRIVAQAENHELALARSGFAAELIFADHGIEVDGAAAIQVRCDSSSCQEPGTQIHVAVRSAVRLPLVPEILGGVVPLEVPVSAEYLAAAPEFRGPP